mgnify:CR=1 FL=1
MCAKTQAVAVLCIFLLAIPLELGAYSVLTHEAIIDNVWKDSIEKVLLKRFPRATPDDLRHARAYAYGGCIMQDMGYYPLGSHLFTDLTHYVRSADFIEALLRDAQRAERLREVLARRFADAPVDAASVPGDGRYRVMLATLREQVAAREHADQVTRVGYAASRVEAEERTKGGIVLPDTAKEKPMKGKVIAVGEGKWDEKGEKRIPVDVKVGETVIYGKYSGTEYKYDGEEVLLRRVSEILAVIE